MLRVWRLLITLTLVGYLDGKFNNSYEFPRKFPEGFMFGTSASSYQIEGAWNEDGKTQNIWDYVVHKVPSPVEDGSTGDTADDSYHNYKRDVQMLRELGVDHHRFSISWTRILPSSFPNEINFRGVAYYNSVIEELLKYNITPMVTLYHWELPQKLQDFGGWTNPNIVDWFGDYVRVVFQLFGDRIKYWITVNEPREICYQGYGDGSMAPLLNDSGFSDYLCSKNLLMAHARAYHIYDKEFRPTQGGKIFISNSANWFEPDTDNDVEAASDTRMFEWGHHVHPIFSKEGDFPQVMKDKIAAKSATQGFFRSRLPVFTPEEIKYVRGTSDFFGLNHYSTFIVYRNESTQKLNNIPSHFDDIGIRLYQKPEWSTSRAGEAAIIKCVPWGFYNVLTEIRERYDNPPIIVTENGFASTPGLDDYDRVDYHRRYLSALLDAMAEGSDIRAYTVWSLMDNFEWLKGYTQRFGLYEVDYSRSDRKRTARKSAFVYKELLRTRILDFHYEPDMSTMTIDKEH